MERVRRYVAVVCLLAMLGITGSAMAARRSDDRPSAPATNQGQKQPQAPQKNPPKGWIKKILDDLENKVSLPPG